MAQQLKLSRVERAAVLLMSLEREQAVAVLKQLGPREIQRLSRAMGSLQQVQREQLSDALQDFFAEAASATGLGMGSDGELRQLLVDALGEERADVLFERVAIHGDTRGLETLRWLDARTIADFISGEHPQIQAVVVAYLDAEHAAEVLTLLPQERRLDIAMRVAALDTVQPAALTELNRLIERRFATASTLPGKSVAGRRVLAAVLKHLPGTEQGRVLDGIGREDQELGGEIEELMFVFEDLQFIEAQDLRALLAEISLQTLALALSDSSLALRQRVFANLPRRVAERLRHALQSGGPRRMSDREAARQEILLIARRMARAGEILIELQRDADSDNGE